MFEVYTILIAAVIVAGVSWGIFGANDTFHPLVYLLPMAGFFYVYMPSILYQEDALLGYFTLKEVTFVQGFNLLCVLALAGGAYWGSGTIRRDPKRRDVFSYVLSSTDRSTLLKIGVVLGAIGFWAYLVQILNVGGFYAAYDSPKGGGWSASGYIRDIDLLLVPAIAFIYLANSNRNIPFWHSVLIGLFAAPLALRGLLTARRGPTFLILVTLIGGWYVVRRKRPSLRKVLVGGGVIGLLMLVLVTYRGQIYLGSPFLTGNMPTPAEMVEKSLDRSTQSSFGNEFMYGTYVVLNAQEQADYYWGARYLTQAFVRPIPSSIWPDKYQDVGMEALKLNAGQLGTADASKHPRIPQGSAPGFASSAYVEWAWGAPLFVFLLGWFYAFLWRKTLVEGGLWTVTYLSLFSTSAYFVAQSFMAVFFRLILMGIPPLVLWVYLRSSAPSDRLKKTTAFSSSGAKAG